MAVIHKCDRCGEETAGKENPGGIELSHITVGKALSVYRDFCRDCRHRIAQEVSKIIDGPAGSR